MSTDNEGKGWSSDASLRSMSPRRKPDPGIGRRLSSFGRTSTRQQLSNAEVRGLARGEPVTSDRVKPTVWSCHGMRILG